MEHLKQTSNPEIQDWILRKGFHSIVDEYLAYIAATTGNLVQVLRGHPDREQLTAAGDILTALIDGGPAEDINDCEDGAAAVGLYLDQITSQNQADLTLLDLLNVAHIRDFGDVLGIDTFDLYVSRLKANPLSSDWYQAWQHADTETRATQIATLAEELIPLQEIATGPENAMGFGKRFRAHVALNWSLQELRSHPGLGAPLLLAAPAADRA